MQLKMLIEDLRPEEKEIARRADSMGIPLPTERVDRLCWPAADAAAEPSTFLIRVPGFYSRVQSSALLECAGHTVYNAPWQLTTFGQKSLSSIWFARHRLPAIPTYVCFRVDTAVAAAQSLGYPVVLKPSIGGFGKLVHWIETERELIQAYEYLEAYAPKTLSTSIVQKALEVKTDLRVVILEGRALAVMERALPGAKVRNISRGATGRGHDLTRQESDVISRLTRVIGPGFFGVDILTDQTGQAYLCEVNAVCGFAEAARVSGVDIAGELLHTLTQHSKARRGEVDSVTTIHGCGASKAGSPGVPWPD